uniref:Uncharacterized protein n=1 Tax=Oryza brachyantha TaxID=4533 RepID=J3N7K8_ORYBR
MQLDKHGNVPRLDNELKPQDADGNLPASFMFGPNSVNKTCINCAHRRVVSLFLEDLQRQQPFSMGRYGSVRKVYVVCKQDRAIPEEFQRWMAASGADHMAMLSAPDEVIVDVAERYH